jgi:hypothetical protein
METLTETDMETDTEMDTETDTDMDKDMDKDTEMDKDSNTDMELEYFARYPYSAIVTITPYGLPVTHHGASLNSTINLKRHLLMRPMTCLF